MSDMTNTDELKCKHMVCKLLDIYPNLELTIKNPSDLNLSRIFCCMMQFFIDNRTKYPESRNEVPKLINTARQIGYTEIEIAQAVVSTLSYYSDLSIFMPDLSLHELWQAIKNYGIEPQISIFKLNNISLNDIIDLLSQKYPQPLIIKMLKKYDYPID